MKKMVAGVLVGLMGIGSVWAAGNLPAGSVKAEAADLHSSTTQNQRGVSAVVVAAARANASQAEKQAFAPTMPPTLIVPS